MATITLQYDSRNKVVKSILKMIEDSGLFLILREKTPNDETLQSIDDAKAGKTTKAKNFNDLMKLLKS